MYVCIYTYMYIYIYIYTHTCLRFSRRAADWGGRQVEQGDPESQRQVEDWVDLSGIV